MPPPSSPAAPGFWRRVWKNKAVVVGCGLLLAIVLIALLAPWISLYDPYAQDLANRTVPPFWYEGGSWAHPLGTDPLGRDYLSRLFYGARISLLIGVSVAVLSGLIGTRWNGTPNCAATGSRSGWLLTTMASSHASSPARWRSRRS